jgi:hypothetical protein
MDNSLMQLIVKLYQIENSWVGGDILVKCPCCGADVASPNKEWDVSPKLHVKQYECCGKKFREYGK